MGAPGGEENGTRAGAHSEAGFGGEQAGQGAWRRRLAPKPETTETSATIVPKGTAPDEPRPQIRRLRMKKTQKMMPGYSSAVARVSVFTASRAAPCTVARESPGDAHQRKEQGRRQQPAVGG